MPIIPIKLLHEIQEQPPLFEDILNTFENRFERLSGPSSSIRQLFAVAEGSSKHALEIASPFLEAWIGLPIHVYDPESLEEKFAICRQFEAPGDQNLCRIFQNGYFIAVSQSGETGSVIRILEKLKESFSSNTPFNELPILAITNCNASTLSQMASEALNINAGPEKSIAATKTMTCSLLTLLLWGLWFGRKRKVLSESAYRTILNQLKTMPGNLNQLWEKDLQRQLMTFSKKLMEVNHFILLSKGILTLILPEIGLKLTETSSNIVYTDNSESFKHGPKVILSGVQGQHPNSIYWVSPHQEEAEGLFRDIKSHFWMEETLAFEDDRVFLVCFENSPAVPSDIGEALNIHKGKILSLPTCHSIFESLFTGLISFQTISYFLAIAKGENPDNPMLEKAVTD